MALKLDDESLKSEKNSSKNMHISVTLYLGWTMKVFSLKYSQKKNGGKRPHYPTTPLTNKTIPPFRFGVPRPVTQWFPFPK